MLNPFTPAIFSIDDARALAKRRLPKLMFDFIDGAAGQEQAKQRNRNALDDILLQPRVLVNVDQRSLNKQFLGRTWDLPFGIAPMGMCNLAWPNTDLLLAQAAVDHNIPLALSTMSSTALETIHDAAGANAWFQLYVGGSEEQAMELVDRVRDVGYTTLIFTVDVPQVAPRLRDMRNGFSIPFRIGPKKFIDFATHPRWSLTSLWVGAPKLGNFPTTGPKAFKRKEGRGKIDWAFLARLRDRWPHQLVVKGVTSAEDAARIQAAGADGIYVSNHGGRQLNSAPAAIHCLPKIRAAVGPDFPLLFDSGVRSGESVVKALAMGADFVMLGRPFLYGTGAGGARGLERVIDLLANEVSVAMAQVGKTSAEHIDQSILAQ